MRRRRIRALEADQAASRERCESAERRCGVLEAAISQSDDRIVELERSLVTQWRDAKLAIERRAADVAAAEAVSRELEETQRRVADLGAEASKAREETAAAEAALGACAVSTARFEERLALLEVVPPGEESSDTTELRHAVETEAAAVGAAKKAAKTFRRRARAVTDRAARVLAEARLAAAKVRAAQQEERWDMDTRGDGGDEKQHNWSRAESALRVLHASDCLTLSLEEATSRAEFS